MTKVMRRACTEVDEILKYLPKEYVEKVPLKFRRMFYDARLDNYEVKINPNRSIKDQNVVYETRVILAILKMNYWCQSEEEKNRVMQTLTENERRFQEKYHIFKSNGNESDNFSEVPQRNNVTPNNLNDISKKEAVNLPVKVKEKSFIFRLWLKIKKIFIKK
ncbi:MAG: hypothetical protein IJ220_02605 [Clostridia bacterium]|nr:hypothetical protein [Clostridia bacterium]